MIRFAPSRNFYSDLSQHPTAASSLESKRKTNCQPIYQKINLLTLVFAIKPEALYRCVGDHCGEPFDFSAIWNYKNFKICNFNIFLKIIRRFKNFAMVAIAFLVRKLEKVRGKFKIKSMVYKRCLNWIFWHNFGIAINRRNSL